MDVNQSYPRLLQAALLEDLRLFPVIAVMGARQVGKSTLCQHVAAQLGMTTCTLDERPTLELARTEPERLLAALGNEGAFIDEAQRAPGLMLAVKAAVDRSRRPGQYLLSGSNQPRMSSAVGDSLLGRAAYRTLRPLTLSELRLDDVHRGWSFLFNSAHEAVLAELRRRAESSGALDWQDAVSTGGFPRAVVTPPTQRLRLLDEYARVFSSRDIRELVGIESSDRFEAFLRLAATRVGQVLNYSGFANDLGVSVNTVRRWMDALGRSYLIELVPPYSLNAAQRTIKAPKLFAVDSAFALAAAGEQSPRGFHLENLVCTDLLVWRDSARARAVYHWRLPAGQEVDFVLEEDRQLVAVEVKIASRVSSGDVGHLRSFIERYPAALRGVLLSSDPTVQRVDPRVIAAPWWAVL